MTKETLKILNTLKKPQIEAILDLLGYMEESEEHKAGIPISELFENSFLAILLEE
jgi:hypothetical protein